MRQSPAFPFVSLSLRKHRKTELHFQVGKLRNKALLDEEKEKKKKVAHISQPRETFMPQSHASCILAALLNMPLSPTIFSLGP